ncbi:hypothetical protein JDS87_09475 [Bacillus cereus]|uniref:hypothetical protein n=1 Tax=Bacillus cereus TaxID=1396 RepID=UPI0018F4CDE7|nr:hypothetical protein [Bacillus cereus]MBJ8052247.1 hypothetical protein [Bacillus cereus]
MMQLIFLPKIERKEMQIRLEEILKKLLQLCKVNVILIDSKSRYLSVFLIGFKSTVCL